MDFRPNPEVEFSQAFEVKLDAACREIRSREKPRTYLGGSRLGVECERALGFEYHHVPKDPFKDFSGRLYRIFDRGHDTETRMAEYLRAAGFTLVTERPDGRQFGFYVAPDQDGNPRMAGHLDGVITAAPEWYLRIGGGTPALWECKALNSKSWHDLRRKGLRASKPIYYVQMQVYMAYMGLSDRPGLFTAMNGDTGEVHACLVPFDQASAQSASDKGARVVSSRYPEELPRVAGRPDDWRCRSCDWSDRCWLPEIAKSGGDPAEAARWPWNINEAQHD